MQKTYLIERFLGVFWQQQITLHLVK
ncbi:uncharacterized protein METZ01_LOCUS185618, partial [marine metagenome]